MGVVDQLIAAGYEGYRGWSDAEAAANFRETGGAGKQGGGSNSGGGSGHSSNRPAVPKFEFDVKKAEEDALKELAPYYQKLLDMYGGNVALAKQRLDEDYAKGLRIQTEATDWTKEGNQEIRKERARLYKVALKRIDQEANSRGIYKSGIRTENILSREADEKYALRGLEREDIALDKALQDYKTDQDVTYRRGAEELGYVNPKEMSFDSQYQPNQAGFVAPNNATLSNYKSGPAQYATTLDQEKKEKAIGMAQSRESRAYSKWLADAQTIWNS